MIKEKSSLNEYSIIIFFSIIQILLHLFVNAFTGYGIFRDELYYLSCAARPDIGYVDQPPLSILFLTIIKFLIGDSVFAIRLIPAVIAGIIIFVTGLITRELGGKRSAVLITCLCMFFAPYYLAVGGIYSMNIYEVFFWCFAYYLVIRIIKESNTTNWLLLGVIIGLGLLTKISFLWFAAGFFAGLLLNVHRKELMNYKPYAAAAIALIIFSPYIIWNFQNNFAHLEFISNASTLKYSGIGRFDFLFGQILMLSPAALPVWLCGIYYFFFDNQGKAFRLIGIIFLITFAVLLINGHAKPEYFAPAFPAAIAGGSIILERIISKQNFGWLKPALISVIILFGIIIMPFVLPIIPVETFISYSKTMGMAPSTHEDNELSELPQFYADMFGWENMAKTVSEVYLSLPEEVQQRSVIFAHNYGEAGAMEYFSDKYKLPGVICPHNNFWIWGCRNMNSSMTIIIIGGDIEDHLNSLEEVKEAGFISSKYAMPYENRKVFIGRKFKTPPKVIWNLLRTYI